jgi:hypothetical protein
MAASEKTVEQVIGVLKKYLPDPARRHQLALELLANVEGNASVLATLNRLVERTFADYKMARKAGAIPTTYEEVSE